MSVLVTGASGRIGRHVTERLLATGRTVRALVVPDDPRRTLDRQDGRRARRGPAGRPGLDPPGGRRHRRGRPPRGRPHHPRAIRTTSSWRQHHGHVRPARRAARCRPPDLAVRGHQLGRGVLGWTRPWHPASSPIDECHPRQPGSVYGSPSWPRRSSASRSSGSTGIPPTIVRPSATADADELIEPDGVFGAPDVRGPGDQGPRGAPPLPGRGARAARRAARGGHREAAALRGRGPGGPDGASRPSTTRAMAAAGIVLALDSPLAVGEAFNVGPAAAYADTELIGYLGERLGVPVVTVRSAQARPSWVVSAARRPGRCWAIVRDRIGLRHGG